ncbi:MAG: divalent-cation tolerance protein CutA [Saprospiraceae bacterium]|nr:divalent-cation tolerance protein CutA [Saprospiraceae bacterium]
MRSKQSFEIWYFHVPCGNAINAQLIGETAVNSGIAACCNISPIRSIYLWQENLHQDEEILLILKTLASQKKKLTHLILELHDYNTPCILSFKANVNKEYFDWMNSMVKKKRTVDN